MIDLRPLVDICVFFSISVTAKESLRSIKDDFLGI